MRVRKDVWKLPQGDTTLLWYGRAIAAMQQKPLADPTSWRYQAAIHDYISGQDPLARQGDVFPADADTYWAQCQHSTWFFLPWHRMYLHHFEEIVAAQVAALGGPAGWALPYWNYSEGGSSTLLPPAFRSPTLDDGSRNALYVAQRDPECNAGQPFLGAQDVDIRALLDPRFDAVGQAGASSFGGPVTQFEHAGGSVTGALEMTPHGNIHVAVAGDSGWMGAFNTAALDPIFWLHHCNLDRLWAVWLAMPSSGHANPPDAGWLGAVSFPFHDASGGAVAMTPGQVLDTTALGYAYDDTSDPLPAAGRPFARAAGVPAPPAQPAEMVGATSQSFDLAGATTHATVPVVTAKATARVARVAQPMGPLRRVFVDVENLTAKARPGSYDVYLGVPVGDEPAAHPDRFAGRLPMFGVVEASRATAKHAGSGMHYALDATELYERLAALPGFDPSQLRVSFVPARAKAGGTVNVGRVSLYFE